jgi:hypothetical protein
VKEYSKEPSPKKKENKSECGEKGSERARS